MASTRWVDGGWHLRAGSMVSGIYAVGSWWVAFTYRIHGEWLLRAGFVTEIEGEGGEGEGRDEERWR